MKTAVLIVTALFLLVALTTATLSSPTAQKLFITQPLDHFNPLNRETFEQLYVLDDADFTPSTTDVNANKLFLYTGGEAEIDYYFNHSGGTFRAWAKKGKGLVAFLEQRFFGVSFPEAPADNKYYSLNLEQIVEDVMKLVVKLNEQYNVKFRVVTAGGSWAGEIAAYARFRYPYLIHAAMASSAPFMMMGYKYTDENPMNYEYYRKVSSVIQQIDPKCNELTRRAFKIIQDLYQMKDYKTIQDHMSLCAPPTKDSDLRQLYAFLRGSFAGLVQSNHPSDDKEQSWPANLTCQFFTNFPSVHTDTLRAITQSFIAASYGPIDKDQKCYEPFDPDWDLQGNKMTLYPADVYKLSKIDTFPNRLLDRPYFYNPEIIPRTMDHHQSQNTLLDSDFDSWFFQMCTQTMYYQNSSGKNATDSMFPRIITTPQQYYSECQRRYGLFDGESTWNRLSTSWPRTHSDWFTTASNIVFSNGNWDPWGCGGLQRNGPLERNLFSLTIPHAAHHLDLNLATDDDTDEVYDARGLEYLILMELIKVTPSDAKLKELRTRVEQRFPSTDCPMELYPDLN